MKWLLTTLLPLLVLLTGCKPDPSPTADGSKSAPKWYDEWMKHPTSAGRIIHSELELDAGETTTIQIPATGPIIVGSIVEKGYELSQEKGVVWIGTPETPHLTGGTPGVSANFSPKDGSISLVVENDSSLKTRVIIYTKAPDPAKKQ